MADNPLQKLVETGAQFTEVSRKQAEAAVKSLVKAGAVRRSDAEDLAQRLVDRGRNTTTQLGQLVQQEVTKQLGRLASRVDDVEQQVEGLVTRVTGRGAAKPKASGSKKSSPKKASASRKKSSSKKTSVSKKAPAKKQAAAPPD
jgi:polyhydroxyalkanoate synthesis regulator phasin